MASLKALKGRIASVKSTQKITKAMKMVAAAKLRRAQQAAEAGRPYAERMEKVMASLAGKVAGHAVSYRHGLSLASWPSVPMLLSAVVVLFGIYTSSPQTPFQSLQLLNVDPLFVDLPLDHPWSTLAKSFSLLNLWVWFLAALGWKTMFRTGWGSALFVVMLPAIVIFGVMALFAIF